MVHSNILTNHFNKNIMINKITALTAILTFLISLPVYSQYNKEDQWTKQEWREANTARFHFYMSKRVRESIRFHNLARMYPDKFSEVYLDSLDNSKDVSVLRKALKISTPMQKLKPSVNLYLSSQIHSVYSGISGHTGHALFLPRMILVKPLSFQGTGENCAYGSYHPLDVSVGLLLSPGHRKNILSENFSRVGGSRFFHSGYGTNTVFNYAPANWIDFSTRIKPDKQDIGIILGTSNSFNKLMLDVGIAYHARHQEFKEYMLELKYHKGVVNHNTDGLSLTVATGNFFGVGMIHSGVKTSVFINDGSTSLYVTPEINIALNIKFFIKRGSYGYSSSKDVVSMYRLSYGYNMPVLGDKNINISKHNIGLSKYINLGTRNN